MSEVMANRLNLGKEKAHYWVYILECANGSYYTGYTTNLTRRYQAHLAGTASKYTRSFKPICVAQCWQILGDKALAMKAECFIKKLSKQAKLNLIIKPENLTAIFPCHPHQTF